MFIPLYDTNKIEHIGFPFVNWTIIVITVAIFVIFQSGLVYSFDGLVEIGFGVVPAVVTDVRVLPVEAAYIPDEVSLVTYAFLHGDWMHLLGNMLFVWVFGDNIEDAVGHLKYLFFYLLIAAVSGYAQVWLTPFEEIPLIGASGAAAGIIGAYLMLHPNVGVWVLALGRIPLRLPASWCLIAWFVFQLVLFATDETGEVAWITHIVGFVAGALLIIVLRRQNVPLFDRT